MGRTVQQTISATIMGVVTSAFDDSAVPQGLIACLHSVDCP